MTTRYRKRPIEVEAWQWLGQPRTEWPAWMDRGALLADGSIIVSGIRDSVRRGEWLVLEMGHLMRVPPALFEATYEKM
jgi:hypothetical protein